MPNPVKAECPQCGGVFRLTGGRLWWHKTQSYLRGPMVTCAGAGQLPVAAS